VNAIRRTYLYAICLVSLQAATWATIALLRGLFNPVNTPVEAAAFQIAVVITALPIFLVHWRWAQGDAARDPQERGAAFRRFYLYLMQALFIVPVLSNTFGLLGAVAERIRGVPVPQPVPHDYLTLRDLAVRNLTAIVVLVVLAAYKWRQVRTDRAVAPEVGRSGVVRRLFVLGFAALGLSLTTAAAIQLLRYIYIQSGLSPTLLFASDQVLTRETARLAVGVPVWLVAWAWVQRLFGGDEPEEHDSALRKFYLYAAVLAGVLGTVTPVAMILAGVLRRALGLPSIGGLEIPLPFVPVMATVWAYHARVLSMDAARAAEVPRQAAVRRLYRYLVGAIGFGAFLLGVAGVARVVLRSLDPAVATASDALSNQLAWATAAALCGLPVWLWQWRRVQQAAFAPAPVGSLERGSIVRRLYLYFFIFVATITVLSSVVYLVFRLMNTVLGGQVGGDVATRVAEAVAYAALGVLVWIFHGRILRSDGRLGESDRAARLVNLPTAVIDLGDGHLGRALLDGLHRALPGLPLEAIGFAAPAAAGQDDQARPESVAERLAGARVIVAPWSAVHGIGMDAAGTDIARAVVGSGAQKILLPTAAPGWAWAGVEPRDADDLVKQVAHAVGQIADGDPVTPARPLGAAQLLLLAIAGIVTFLTIVGPIVSFILGEGLGNLTGP
jgi:hypothetical protein